jgi:genome maintenance exonuclease 1
MFNSIKPFLNRINNIQLQEKSLYSNHLETAGRVDCIAEFDGRLSIIDFKTSSKPKSKEWITNYFCQGSAYAVMYEELTGVPVDTIAILIAVEGDEPQLFRVKRDDYIAKYIDIRNRYRQANGI